MTPDAQAPKSKTETPPIEVEVTKRAVVFGTDRKPALEVILSGQGDVRVNVLPKNGQRRSPVKLVHLKDALDRLYNA